MKKYLLLYKILFLSIPAFAQISIPSGTRWVNSGTINIVVSDLDLVNNGSFSKGANVKFSGSQNSVLSGASICSFNVFELAKTNGAKVILGQTININSSINFSGGVLDLNSNNISLDPTAVLSGESEASRIIGKGGYVEITQSLNAPVAADPGNLGATISSSANLGTVIIRRGAVSQSGNGLDASVQRYYYILPQNNTALNATLRLAYFDAELNGQNENNLVQYQSSDAGTNWSNLSETTRNTSDNYVEKTGINGFSLLTLANDISVNAVTGLVLNAKRKKPSEVQLTWSTATENNMLGFEVQRQLDNELDFSDRNFVTTKAPGGNSNSGLSYSYTDANPYSGISYYRLKIIDKNNFISYSDIKSVAGKVKNGNNLMTLNGTDTIQTMITVRSAVKLSSPKRISVGPNPNNGNFWFMLSGTDRKTVVELYAVDGKLVRQFYVSGPGRQQVSGIKSGIYILKAEGAEPFKIIVQGDGGSDQFSSASGQIKN